MFKFVLASAAALSLVLCIAYDVRSRTDLAETQRVIAQRQDELRKLSAIDEEVRTFQQRKGELQQRIDLINQVRQFQSTTSDAVAMLSQLGTQAAAIESVTVTDAKKIVVHGRAASEKLIHDAAKRLGLTNVEVRQ